MRFTKSPPELSRNLLASALLTVFAACGGGSGGGGNNPSTPPPPPPASFGPNFSEIQSSVFTPTCATSGCHQGAGAPQGLRLDDANSYGLLVDVDSNQVPSIKRVAPGDPDNSYLVQKLEGTASVGQQMPLNGTPLAQADIDTIRQWISDGAIDDRTPSSAPIRVTSLSPVPDSTLNTVPTEIIAMFDRELDVSTVNTTTFVLTASGGDGTFGDPNDVVVGSTTISTPAMTPMSATMDLSAATINDDTYQVQLLGDGASTILDIDANRLDGEFSGNFPSGDGTEGGDFVATFVVATQTTTITFDEIQTQLFTPTCATAGCHSGASPPQGLNLEAGNAFSNLVNVSSMQVPALFRVNPGNPDDSYLIRKLEGTASVGSRMPLGGAAIEQSRIDEIRQWIADGANP